MAYPLRDVHQIFSVHDKFHVRLTTKIWGFAYLVRFAVMGYLKRRYFPPNFNYQYTSHANVFKLQKS